MKRQSDGIPNPSSPKSRRLDPDLCREKYVPKVLSLLECSTKAVAQSLPFEYVESTLVNIPEQIQDLIIYYSFPQDSRDIKTYSSFMSCKCGLKEKSPFTIGEQILSKKCVEDVIQIGFHLTGVVKAEAVNGGLVETKSFKVSMTFDRCKIKSVHCTCSCRGLSWCAHAVALALFRIYHPKDVEYRSPISDTLVKMDRSQLQKFAQYLIASHPNRVLASAQTIADRLLRKDSQINSTNGAPDPTAGAGLDETPTWYFDESGVRDQLRLDLSALANYSERGYNGFEGSTQQTANASNTTASVNGSTNAATLGINSASLISQLYGRVVANNTQATTITSEATRYRSNRNSTRYSQDESNGTSDAIGFKSRSTPPRPFTMAWMENYRRLLDSKLPPFGFPNVGSQSNSSQPSSHSTFHQVVNLLSGGLPPSLLGGYSPSNSALATSNHFPGSQLAMVFAKTYELLAARDTNGPRLLAIVTEELLKSADVLAHKSRRSNRVGGPERTLWDPFDGAEFNDVVDEVDVPDVPLRQGGNEVTVNQPPPPWTIPLWDEVIHIWTCLLLSPGYPSSLRESWRERLISWSASPNAPKDDTYYIPPSNTIVEAPATAREVLEPTSVFQLPIDVGGLSLTASEVYPNCLPTATPRSLHGISTDCLCPYCTVSAVIQYQWGEGESFLTGCLRVAALQMTGFEEAASELAVCLANTLLSCLEITARSIGAPYADWQLTIPPGMLPRGPFKPPPSYPYHQHNSLPPVYYPDAYPPVLNYRGRQPSTSTMAHQRGPKAPDPSQMLDCTAEVSLLCPLHEHGWLGLPGRPITSLIECLLESAARKLKDPSVDGLSPLDYVHLALKVGIVVLCQQRSLPPTNTSLLAIQAQEMVLVHLLNTVPRNPTTAQLITPLVTQLMGPRIAPVPMEPRSASGSRESTWWWSALGPVVHPDTYPVHVAAELLFGHLTAGKLSNPNTERLAYLVFSRAMRFPVLEPSSDSLMVTAARSQPQIDGVSRPMTLGAVYSPPLPSILYSTATGAHGRPFMTAAPSIVPPSDFRCRQDPSSQSRRQQTAVGYYRRDLGAMEGRQARLAIGLILASRHSLSRVDQIMRVCDRHIHTFISLLCVSREILSEAIGYKLHNASSSFTLNEPSLYLSNGATGSGAQTSSNGLGFANILPVNFVTSNLPTNAFQERLTLVCAAFHLALCVASRTAWPQVNWRRREMLGWAVSTGLLAGPTALLHLAQFWSTYTSPGEAVTWLAPTLLACLACVCSGNGTTGGVAHSGPVNYVFANGGFRTTTTTSRNGVALPAESSFPVFPRVYSFLTFTTSAVEQIKDAVRQMTIQAAAQDPVNCALTALQLTELDAASFETTYRLVVEAAKSGSLGPSHIFSAARHLDSRGYPLWAFPLTIHAMKMFSLSGLQESHPLAQDVLWSCLLAHRIGSRALQEILVHVVRNVHCPTLLADILHRCRLQPAAVNLPPSQTMIPPASFPIQNRLRVDNSHMYQGYYSAGKVPQSTGLLPVDVPPLKALLDATISAFVTTTHARLASISPRQYGDFLDFLARARDTFNLHKPDGPAQFGQLISSLCHSHRGKRKLVALLNERFFGHH